MVRNTINLESVPFSGYPMIQNMGRFYVYDMSRYMKGKEWALPSDGLFECIDFKKYWEDKNAFPFLVKVNREIAGFAIIDKRGTTKDVEFNMAQFFILARFQNRGIGRNVAHLCFKKFHGLWEVMVMPENIGAQKFWKKAISSYTQEYELKEKKVRHFGNGRRNIFRFKS